MIHLYTYINGFSKKKKKSMIQDKRETHHYSNSAKGFFKICTMKAAKRYIHENYVNGFSKKIFFWAKCAIWDPKMISSYF